MNRSKLYFLLLIPAVAVILTACRISYGFTGTSIDYTVTKSITINDFPNQAALVYPPLAQAFTEELRDKYTRQTRLQMTTSGGDIEIEGEIIGYDLAPMAVKEDNYSSMTKLTMTVRVRYTNKATPDKDFEQTFSAYREFDSNLQLQDVQDDLDSQMSKEIVEQIFNATVADW
jgi:hypothetical protein